MFVNRVYDTPNVPAWVYQTFAIVFLRDGVYQMFGFQI